MPGRCIARQNPDSERAGAPRTSMALGHRQQLTAHASPPVAWKCHQIRHECIFGRIIVGLVGLDFGPDAYKPDHLTGALGHKAFSVPLPAPGEHPVEILASDGRALRLTRL